MTTLNNRLKLALLNRRRSNNALEKGFTLVELMIVIVIVGILSAVALPNFLGTRDKATAGSLVGSMSAFAKQCGANMVIGDPVAVAPPGTITITNGGVCNGGANVSISNATAFTAANIGGVRCGSDANTANGTSNTTCTLTVDQNSGSVTGAWTP